jgi:hypothetical protein
MTSPSDGSIRHGIGVLFGHSWENRWTIYSNTQATVSQDQPALPMSLFVLGAFSQEPRGVKHLPQTSRAILVRGNQIQLMTVANGCRSTLLSLVCPTPPGLLSASSGPVSSLTSQTQVWPRSGSEACMGAASPEPYEEQRRSLRNMRSVARL